MIEDTMIHGGWPRWPGPDRIEHDTPIVPHAVASAVWEEAGAWLGEELPREWRARLMERAEAVYASNARVSRRLRGPDNSGRDWLWTFMRHWLAALLDLERPDLYQCLPEDFNLGHRLPPGQHPLIRRKGFVPTLLPKPRPWNARRVLQHRRWAWLSDHGRVPENIK